MAWLPSLCWLSLLQHGEFSELLTELEKQRRQQDEFKCAAVAGTIAGDRVRGDRTLCASM